MSVSTFLRQAIFTVLLVAGISASVTAQHCLSDSTFSANATYYGTPTQDICGFPVVDSPLYIAAVSPEFFDSSATCGACIEVTSYRGTLVMMVQEICPTCVGPQLDLTTDASNVLDTSVGRTAVNWKYVGCPVIGPLNIYLSSGSNLYYLHMQVRNHRYPVKSVLFRSNNSGYITLQRTPDNYYEQTGGGPYNNFDLKIIDILGDTVSIDNIGFAANSVFTATEQFPVCTATAINEIANHAPTISVRNNPSTSGQFFLQNRNMAATDYRIVDVVGRVVATGRLAVYEQAEVTLKEKGLYLLYDASGIGSVQKLVVQ